MAYSPTSDLLFRIIKTEHFGSFRLGLKQKANGLGLGTQTLDQTKPNDLLKKQVSKTEQLSQTKRTTELHIL